MRFTPNARGIEDVIESAGTKRVLKDVAGEVRDEVESQAERFANTRHFASSIEVTDVVPQHDGIAIAVHSTDHAAHIIEYGSKNNPAYAPFRKAASALGLKLGPGRRI